MSKTKRILITSETIESIVLREHDSALHTAYCSECGTDVYEINLDMAVSMLGSDWTQVMALAGTGKVHTLPAKEGRLLLCSSSLMSEHRPVDR